MKNNMLKKFEKSKKFEIFEMFCDIVRADIEYHNKTNKVDVKNPFELLMNQDEEIN